LGERDLKGCNVRFSSSLPSVGARDLKECNVRFSSSLSPVAGERAG
jgi:hypothetical protein